MSANPSSQKNNKTRNWVILVAVVITGLFAWRFFASANSANAIATTINETKVTSLEVAETVETSGSLEAQPFASLKWKTGGVVDAVNVQPGDFVKADDVLLTLQPASTTAAIVSAQADLVTAQKNLDDLLKSDTASAKAVVDLQNAQDAYDKAKDYYDSLFEPYEYDKIVYKTIVTPAGVRRIPSIKSVEVEEADEETIADAGNDLALKQAQWEDAQRNYDRLKDGPNAQDILAAQARVDAAQATVNMLSIIAPFDGVVLSVDQRAGDVVNTGELSVNMADLDHLYVETQVDESDVAMVKVGDQAEVTLDAVVGVTLTGRVAAVNPVGQAVGGLVKYNVRIELDPVQDTFLPLGATANVVIKIGGSQATLAVPIVAIQNDSQGEYVWVVRDGEPVRVDVVGGSIIGDMVAVTGDLQDGEVLQIVHENSFNAPNLFGGQQ
jgi:HlyD family secretion protein